MIKSFTVKRTHRSNVKIFLLHEGSCLLKKYTVRKIERKACIFVIMLCEEYKKEQHLINLTIRYIHMR